MNANLLFIPLCTIPSEGLEFLFQRIVDAKTQPDAHQSYEIISTLLQPSDEAEIDRTLSAINMRFGEERDAEVVERKERVYKRVLTRECQKIWGPEIAREIWRLLEDADNLFVVRLPSSGEGSVDTHVFFLLLPRLFYQRLIPADQSTRSVNEEELSVLKDGMSANAARMFDYAVTWFKTKIMG